MAVYIVLLGPPGAGKGTQAKVISEKIKLPHISSGELFRENLKAQTELGKLVQGYIKRGELVPDEITIGMVKERLEREDCKEGALLDGFPRTRAQAEALAQMLAQKGETVDAVPYIAVPPKVLIERLSGRWSCRAQGHVYHEVYNPSKIRGVCDVDGSDLYQREDDRAETVENRINIYFEQTSSLIDYYRSRNLLLEVDGTKPIEEVSREIFLSLEKVV
ncbi:MAG: adenylate kinase [Anaerolineaceae bacterium]|nr:adenylate kinase [Anaerolineaceae bacterium]